MECCLGAALYRGPNATTKGEVQGAWEMSHLGVPGQTKSLHWLLDHMHPVEQLLLEGKTTDSSPTEVL